MSGKNTVAFLVLTPDQICQFRAMIWDFYARHRRIFAWRHVEDPYAVLVSEIMLQQTQTYRVAGKYEHFLTELPNFKALAGASSHTLLRCWQGLGYNRRALYLQKIAQLVVSQHNGQLPNDPQILQNFPGLGAATAASVCVFSFNRPHVFIETNIRAVFIHSFFGSAQKVHDREIMPLVEQTLDASAPRDWFYALMDFGVMLKKTYANPSRASAHHTKQSKFEGSDRQLRGAVLRALLAHKNMPVEQLVTALAVEPERAKKIVMQLQEEKFLVVEDGQAQLF